MYLSNVDIPDLEFFANLTALKYLSLRSSDVDDFAGLAHLSGIGTLILDGAGINKLGVRTLNFGRARP